MCKKKRAYKRPFLILQQQPYSLGGGGGGGVVVVFGFPHPHPMTLKF